MTEPQTPVPEVDRRPLQTVALVLFVCIGTVFVLVQWRAILLPIVVAVVVWYIILALAKVFAILPIPNVLLPRRVCLAAAILTVFATGAVFVELIAHSVTALQVAAPRYEVQIEALMEQGARLIGLEEAPSLEKLQEDFDLASLAGTAVSSATSLFFDTLLVFAYVVFLLVQQRYLPNKLRYLVPDDARRARLEAVFRQISKEIQTYLAVMTLLAVVTGVITYIVLALVGIDFAVLWSLIIALFSFIPTIGTAFGIVFPALIALLQFDTITPFLVVLISLGTLQLLLNNVAQPVLMGRSMNVSPFVILVSLAVWGWIWGIVGAVLSVPITVAMMIILARFPATRPVAVILSLDGEIEHRPLTPPRRPRSFGVRWRWLRTRIAQTPAGRIFR